MSKKYQGFSKDMQKRLAQKASEIKKSWHAHYNDELDDSDTGGDEGGSGGFGNHHQGDYSLDKISQILDRHEGKAEDFGLIDSDVISEELSNDSKDMSEAADKTAVKERESEKSTRVSDYLSHDSSNRDSSKGKDSSKGAVSVRAQQAYHSSLASNPFSTAAIETHSKANTGNFVQGGHAGAGTAHGNSHGFAARDGYQNVGKFAASGKQGAGQGNMQTRSDAGKQQTATATLRGRR